MTYINNEKKELFSKTANKDRRNSFFLPNLSINANPKNTPTKSGMAAKLLKTLAFYKEIPID